MKLRVEMCVWMDHDPGVYFYRARKMWFKNRSARFSISAVRHPPQTAAEAHDNGLLFIFIGGQMV